MSEAIIVSGRRRTWPDELKRRILAEATEPGESICSVARRYEVDPAQLYQWRKKFRDARVDGLPAFADQTFLPVDVTPGGAAQNGCSDSLDADPPASPRIVIAFPNGRQLYVPASLERKYLDTLIAAVAAS